MAGNVASIHGVALRITRLGADGKPVVGEKNSYVTDAFMKIGFTPEYTTGDEIEEKNAHGEICTYYQGPDVMKRVSLSLALCNPDPEVTQLLVGGQLLLPSGGGDTDPVGYASPATGEEGTPHGVAIEAFSHAIMNGRPASVNPYWHWVFPFAKLTFTGERAMENGRMGNEFQGWGLGNEDFGSGPAGEWKYASDKPFQYARTATAPVGLNEFEIVGPVS